jgi:protein-tyrosine phosphatase
MTQFEWTDPRPLGGIRNFGWAVPGVLARGEQPALEAASFAALYEHGIRTVLSLRPDNEAPPAVARRIWPDYHVDDERRLVEAAGMQFRHAPLEDFSAPGPLDMARALTVLDEAVNAAPAVYVHCRAGAGRAAVVSGTWMVASGRSGDEAAAMYERCMHHIAETVAISGAQRDEMLQRVGQPHVWWALRECVAALGSPVTHDIDLLPAACPPGGEGWALGFRDALRPWRARRTDSRASCAAAAD